MDWKTYLLSQKGWQDSQGNTVVFSSQDLNGNQGELWLFLDEGLRCGGRNVCIHSVEEIKNALLGCGKQELWMCVQKDLEGAKQDVCRKIDRGTDS